MEADEGLGAAFPSVPDHWLDEMVFALAYSQHGGSGLGLSAEYVEALDVSRVIWFYEKLDEVRTREGEILRGDGG